MIRRKKQAAQENHERWLVSYADFITLLFAFFVVMFANGQTDKSKAKQLSESVRAALEKGHFSAAISAVLGGTVGDKGMGNAQRQGPGGAHRVSKAEILPAGTVVAELLPSLDRLNSELAREIKDGKIQVSLQARGLVVSLREAAFFPSGQDAILPDSYPIIEKLASAVSKLPNPIRFEGHTDAVPIHNTRFRNNWELSAARSVAMLELFRDRYSIPQQRMAIAGYAETVPVAANDTEEGRTKNRRVDLVILNMRGLTTEPAGTTPAGQPATAPAHP